jgi:hypothetical protein
MKYFFRASLVLASTVLVWNLLVYLLHHGYVHIRGTSGPCSLDSARIQASIFVGGLLVLLAISLSKSRR